VEQYHAVVHSTPYFCIIQFVYTKLEKFAQTL